MRVKALESISGTYGFAHAGEVIDMTDSKAEELIELKLVEPFEGKIAEKNVKVAFDLLNKAKIMGQPKEVHSKEEPSKAGETDPANATVDPVSGQKEEKKATGRSTKEQK